MSAPKILVTGDSWSAGEWDTSKTNILDHARRHSLAYYLAELGYSIRHNPYPGWGDFQSISVIDHFDFDYIVYVKTCATREFKHLTQSKNPIWFAEPSIHKKIDIINNAIYSMLSTYSNRLILLGGLEKIRSNFSCFLCIPSIVEHFYPHFKDSYYFGDISHYESFVDTDKSGALELMQGAKRKINFMQNNPDLFYPDGVHPNRTAQKQLANFIHNHLRQI